MQWRSLADVEERFPVGRLEAADRLPVPQNSQTVVADCLFSELNADLISLIGIHKISVGERKPEGKCRIDGAAIEQNVEYSCVPPRRAERLLANPVLPLTRLTTDKCCTQIGQRALFALEEQPQSPLSWHIRAANTLGPGFTVVSIVEPALCLNREFNGVAFNAHLMDAGQR